MSSVPISDRSGVSDVRFDPRQQLRCHLANAVLFRMLAGLPEHLLLGLAPHDVLTAAGRVHLGALENLGHARLLLTAGAGARRADGAMVGHRNRAPSGNDRQERPSSAPGIATTQHASLEQRLA